MIHAYAAKGPKQPLAPFEYDPGPLGDSEVEVAVTHCGICHSDLSMADNEWGFTAYPLVPGHEAVGTVAALGKGVTTLKIGQRVGVGWLCGSCGVCEWCLRGKDHLCPEQRATIVGHHGGYADRVRSQARFALPIPEGLSSAEAAPLMCAGSTVYSPLVHQGVRPGMKAAVVGIGGLGHLAIQYLAKFGCEVTAISGTPSKEAEARKLGATGFIATQDPAALGKAAMRFDFLMDTVSGDLPWQALIDTLRPEGKLVICGVPASELKFNVFPLISMERAVVGGRLGSAEDTKDMLDFSAAHGVKPMVETFGMKDVNKAFEHVRANKARYRAVLAV
ncbi:MAG TPA: NAD(P)-dependent alcohol dehydrogenase [Planctomycetota bacterium]|nr:NAD(P)-dependent alcohol dehydrogenase [Planctomycetota bacterium]